MSELAILTDEQLTIDLTAEEQLFCGLVAKGYSGVTAYRQAFPAKSKLAYSTVRVNASKLLTKTNISTEVATRQERSSRMARLAEERIEEILVEGSIDSKNNKVADVSMFMYEQANGKATQKVEHKGVFVNVQYDLSGGKGGAVPQDVLDALKD